jgi:hypothetical protein
LPQPLLPPQSAQTEGSKSTVIMQPLFREIID